MHKPESILENETHEILWDFDIQTGHLIPVRRLDLVLFNKEKKLSSCGFCYFANHKVKLKESKNIDEYFHLARELKKLWDKRETVILIVAGALGTIS